MCYYMCVHATLPLYIPTIYVYMLLYLCTYLHVYRLYTWLLFIHSFIGRDHFWPLADKTLELSSVSHYIFNYIAADSHRSEISSPIYIYPPQIPTAVYICTCFIPMDTPSIYMYICYYTSVHTYCIYVHATIYMDTPTIYMDIVGYYGYDLTVCIYLEPLFFLSFFFYRGSNLRPSTFKAAALTTTPGCHLNPNGACPLALYMHT